MCAFPASVSTTSRGSSYNAYLIVDEKIVLVDSVHRPFAQEMMERIREIIDPSEIDYVVANHAEPDHAGSIFKILELNEMRNGKDIQAKPQRRIR